MRTSCKFHKSIDDVPHIFPISERTRFTINVLSPQIMQMLIKKSTHRKRAAVMDFKKPFIIVRPKMKGATRVLFMIIIDRVKEKIPRTVYYIRML